MADPKLVELATKIDRQSGQCPFPGEGEQALWEMAIRTAVEIVTDAAHEPA